MYGLKIKDTYYKGYRFRSRLEARWAVFFDACGVDWEYEPEGYDLGNGMSYLPDFKLHGVCGRDGGDLFVEVKGIMNEHAAAKINRFVEIGKTYTNRIKKSNTAVLVVGRIPEGESMRDIDSEIEEMAYYESPYPDCNWPHAFNFETIDGDYFAAHPGINKKGKFELFGDDSNYLADRDNEKTLAAFNKARQARFEFGETPEGR